MSKLSATYAEYYKPLLTRFCEKLTDRFPADAYEGIPHPFIPAWGQRYEQAMVKMAVIGLETRWWDPTLPTYIADVQSGRWESSFDVSEFQNLDYTQWTNGHRHTFWGFVMYFLASLYEVENWEVLKQHRRPEILNGFVWGNATAIERWESEGIPKDIAKREAHQVARDAAYELNDYRHLQTIFAPNVSIIMCARGACNNYLRNTEKTLLWDKDGVRMWTTKDGLIFNMPHPNAMRFGKGADYYAGTIRSGLLEHKLFYPLPEFMDCDQEAEAFLSDVLGKCKDCCRNTKQAVALIATELKKQDAKMTVRMLCNILNKLGYRTGYGTEYVAGRGSYRMIAGAWHYYRNVLNRPDTADAIALAFTKPNGDYAYMDY